MDSNIKYNRCGAGFWSSVCIVSIIISGAHLADILICRIWHLGFQSRILQALILTKMYYRQGKIMFKRIIFVRVLI